jgi:hypothetical protein
VGVLKLRLTGKAMEAGNFVAYPGFEADAGLATDAAIQGVLGRLDAAERALDEAQVVAALGDMTSMGLNLETGINGVYNLFDKDGYHYYCVYGGTRVLKCFDDNDPAADVRIVAFRNVAEDLPADIARSVSRIIGLAMT